MNGKWFKKNPTKITKIILLMMKAFITNSMHAWLVVE